MLGCYGVGFPTRFSSPKSRLAMQLECGQAGTRIGPPNSISAMTVEGQRALRLALPPGTVELAKLSHQFILFYNHL